MRKDNLNTETDGNLCKSGPNRSSSHFDAWCKDWSICRCTYHVAMEVSQHNSSVKIKCVIIFFYAEVYILHHKEKKKKKTLQIIFVSFLIYRKRIWKNWNEFHILITNIIAIWHKLKKICYIDVWRTFLDSFIVSLRKALKVGRLSELNI